ncbi:MAG TPA: PKD domain-containing protein [Longimicrobium sp.]|nr:PKD domain-containing protein [Longimicrobium sp.]
MRPSLLRRLVLLPLLLAACTDQPTAPGIAPPGEAAQSDALTCEADVRAQSMGCDGSTSGGVMMLANGGARMQIIGGQGINVRLSSSNARYDSVAEIFSVDVTVQNLTSGIMGTYHGDDVAGIQVFFQAEPIVTAGTGEAPPANTDGAGAFTGVQQVYYKYANVLEPGETTPARTWEFSVPRSADRFGFVVYVEAPLIPAATPPEFGIYQQMSPGGGNSCGLLVDGRAFCWGLSYEGALGYGGRRNFTDPVAVAGNHRFTQIATSTHSCGIATNHDLYCWGTNANGEIGAPPTVVVEGQFYGNTRHNPAPTKVLGNISWSAVDVGSAFSCGLDRQGAAYCWGTNEFGQLGTGGFTPTSQPAAVTGGHRFTSIQSGSWHTCALKENGEVWCWGMNRYRHLGATSAQTCDVSWAVFDCSSVPVQVETTARFASLDVGADHTCALTAAGVPHCWGRTLMIASDDSDPPDAVPVPTAVATPEPLARIALGGDGICGVATDGDGYCWGRGVPNNPYGQVVAVAPGFKWRELRPGHNSFRCGVSRELGEGYCWGNENAGQLGNGGLHQESHPAVPQQLAPLHAGDQPPQAGFTLGIGGREATVFVSEPLWSSNSPIYSDDDFGIVKFYWSFGDGTTAEGRVARHQYARNGEYPVTLTVVDGSGQRAMHTEWATIFVYEGE